MWFSRLFGKRKEEIDPDMKYLIVGIGNVGAKYDDTRHNVGFEVVDHIAKQSDAKWKSVSHGMMTTVKHKGRHLLLLKPNTYVNLSGKAVRYWLQKEKIPTDNLLVVVDDLHIDFGTIRLRGKGSDGGHNGIKDINATIGSKYARLRVGIGADFHKGQQVDYVLGTWTDEQKDGLPKILKKSTEVTQSFAAIGLAHTMSNFNNK